MERLQLTQSRRISISVVESSAALDNEFLTLDVFPDMTLNDLKALVTDDINVPGSSQHYFLNNQLLTDASKTLEQLNVSEGDMLGLAVRDARSQRRPQEANSQQRQQRNQNGPDAERFRLHLLADQRMMSQVRNRDPELANSASNAEAFSAVWERRQQGMQAAEEEKREQMALIDADPFNVEAQTKIEEIIRQQQVQENVQRAFEENPEGKSSASSIRR